MRGERPSATIVSNIFLRVLHQVGVEPSERRFFAFADGLATDTHSFRDFRFRAFFPEKFFKQFAISLLEIC